MEKTQVKKHGREPLSHEVLSRVVGGVDMVGSLLCPRCYKWFSTLTREERAVYEAHVKRCQGN